MSINLSAEMMMMIIMNVQFNNIVDTYIFIINTLYVQQPGCILVKREFRPQSAARWSNTSCGLHSFFKGYEPSSRCRFHHAVFLRDQQEVGTKYSQIRKLGIKVIGRYRHGDWNHEPLNREATGLPLRYHRFRILCLNKTY